MLQRLKLEARNTGPVMAQTQQEDQNERVWANQMVYPDASVVFAWHPKPIEAVKEDAIFVLDTNVLTVPYTINSKKLFEIGRAYRVLAKENRLIVPGQVAREFAAGRAVRLADLQEQLLNKKSKAVGLKIDKYPLLESTAELQKVMEIETAINPLMEQYRAALGALVDEVRDWGWTDPVSRLYEELFIEQVVLDPDFDRGDVERDLQWRRENKIPPGYKDAGKEDQGIGDLLIWRTILDLGRTRKLSVVFVTNEEKADWWHRSGGRPTLARHELIEEFRRATDGLSFHITSLSEFLKLFDVQQDVVNEVREREREQRIGQELSDNRPSADSFTVFSPIGGWNQDPQGAALAIDDAVKNYIVRRFVRPRVTMHPLAWRVVAPYLRFNMFRSGEPIEQVLDELHDPYSVTFSDVTP